MKKLYNLICFILNFIMLLSTFIFVVNFSLQYLFPNLFIMTNTFFRSYILLIGFIFCVSIMKNHYNYTTHHLFD